MNVGMYVSGAAFVRQKVGTRRAPHEIAELRLNQFLALALLVVLAPVMLIVAWLIWRNDEAPLLFSHYRVGREGKLFRCFKFRTMYRESEKILDRLLRTDPAARASWQRDQKLLDDPRVTPIGRFLRSTSLDELPQLFNVLRGDMNLVGPRPITVDELDRYGVRRWHYLAVRPGITGLWQVSGRNDLSYDQRVELDRRYVELRSVAFDLAILIRTVGVVLTRNGAR